MVNVAQSEVGVPIHLTDSMRSDALQCSKRNDHLRKGELRKHRREDFISKISPATYNPQAPAPLWDSFVNGSTDGSEGLAEYLARTAGYSLTGETTEHALFLFYGEAPTEVDLP